MRPDSLVTYSRIDINPKGLVPAIEYKGQALYESLVLCEFLEDAYPNHGPNLLPADPFKRAHARLWIDFITKSFIPPYFRLIQSQDAKGQDTARNDVYEALRTLAGKRVGPYFLGKELSLVDVAIVPWIVRDYIVIEHRGFKREDVSPVWKEWAEELEKLESVKKTTSVRVDFWSLKFRLLNSCTGQGTL